MSTPPPAPAAGAPDEVAASVALAEAFSLGGRDAMAANLLLAGEVFAQNLQQQNRVATQQATNILLLAAAAKCAQVLLSDATGDAGATELRQLVDSLRTTIGAIQPSVAPAQPSAEKGRSEVPAAAKLPAAAQDSGGSSAPRSFGASFTEVAIAVAIGNAKAVAEQPAMLSNLAYANVVANTNLAQQDAVAQQQAANEVLAAVVRRAVGLLGEGHPKVEAGAKDGGAPKLGELEAAITGFVQPPTTPSETATGARAAARQ